MNNFYSKPTITAPMVNLNGETGILQFKGRMITVDTHVFFEPFLIWINEYLKNPQPKTIIEIQNNGHMNSVYYRTFYNIFKKFEVIVNERRKVEVKWFLEDTEYFEEFEQYIEYTTLPIEFIVLEV